MSSESNAQQDPSMEEILASIRRIISEGDEEGAPEEGAEEQVGEEAPAEEAEAPEEIAEVEAAPEPEEAAAPAPDDEDVLELTDVVDDDEVAPEAGDIEVDLVEDEGAAEELGGFQADEVEVAAEESQGGALMTDADRLVSDGAAAESSDAFAELAQSVAAAEIRHDTSPRIAHGGERTLEDVVREALRPLLKDWLDKNLPSLVHHLVKKEIERLSRR